MRDHYTVGAYHCSSSAIRMATLSALGNIAASSPMFIGTAGKSRAPMV